MGLHEIYFSSVVSKTAHKSYSIAHNISKFKIVNNRYNRSLDINSTKIKDALHSIRQRCRIHTCSSSLHRRKITSLEKKFSAYLHAFGDPMHFLFVSDMFDELYHEDFKVEDDGQQYGREMLRQCHAHFFDLGCIAELLEFKPIGCKKVEARFVVTSEDIEVLVHSEMSVKGNHHQDGTV
jgi:hypothetical protein